MSKTDSPDQIKYAVWPGYVMSRNDWERHFISAYRLISLYKVKHAECIVIPYRRPSERSFEYVKKLINLFHAQTASTKYLLL